MQNIRVEPSVVKACSRCRARKVKCDLRMPECSACTRHEERCDITDCVAYSHSTVEALLTRIRSLEAQPQSLTSNASDEHQNLPTVPSQPAVSQENLSKEAEEIGILAVGGPSSLSAGAYIGSASGSTLARIFFKQLSLSPEHLGISPKANVEGCHRGNTIRQASLPPPSIVRRLLEEYATRVHVWWPFLALPFVLSVFEQIYREPKQCGDYEKFLVFAVLALASRSAKNTGLRTLDMNTPESYFQSCLNFFSGFRDAAPTRKLPSIHAVLLVGLWLMETSEGLGDLWHLSRHAMSSAIEAGLHRHNADWGFEEKEAEVRNRTWWCVYNLERQIATMTGRVLSIRDHAIQVPLPADNASLDRVNFDSRIGLFTAQMHVPAIDYFRGLIELRRLSGRILESVYVRRHHSQTSRVQSVNLNPGINDEHLGGHVETSFQRICAQAETIGLELSTWDQNLMALSPRAGNNETGNEGDAAAFTSVHSQYISEMRIECSLLQLLLYRPSPVFMVPSAQMVLAAGQAAARAIDECSALAKHRAMGACTSVRHLHQLMVAGLALLYCDWRTIQASRDHGNGSSAAIRLETHTKPCLTLLQSGVSRLGYASFSKYIDIFEAVMGSVYANMPQNSSHTGESQLRDAEQNENRIPFLGEEVDIYLSQVGTLMDDGTFGLDETLNEWYNALIKGRESFSPFPWTEEM